MRVANSDRGRVSVRHSLGHESSSRSSLLFEHDLRANGFPRLSRGKTGIHFSGSCSIRLFLRAASMAAASAAARCMLLDISSVTALCSSTPRPVEVTKFADVHDGLLDRNSKPQRRRRKCRSGFRSPARSCPSPACLVGEVLHLRCDHGKTAPRLAAGPIRWVA